MDHAFLNGTSLRLQFLSGGNRLSTTDVERNFCISYAEFSHLFYIMLE